MLWVTALAMTLASGWFLAAVLTDGMWKGPRWATLLAELALASLFGPGVVSILYFAMAIVGVANRAMVFAMLAVLLAASAAWWGKNRASAAPAHEQIPRTFRWTWALWIGVAIGMVFFILDFQAASSGNPTGQWDAMAIWNLRARYLASGGELWHGAVSADWGAPHPGYPLFLSSFVGLLWSAAGGLGAGFDENVPIVVSLLFALGTLVLLGASLASRRSVALGLLAWLVLLASEVFASQSAVQYSDLLQALAFLAVLVLLDLASANVVANAEPRVYFAAGLAIGLTAWIKNEGLPFALAALVVALWRLRLPRILWVCLGALPGFLALAVLKLFFVYGRKDMFPRTMADAISKITTAGRWGQAAVGFGKAIYEAGNPWTHPVLLAVLLAIALGFVPAVERRSKWWLLIPIGATAAAEYGLFLITTSDLNWHISTSVNRLVAQLWPSLIWVFFIILREPEDSVPPEPVLVGVRADGGPKRGSAKAAKRR